MNPLTLFVLPFGLLALLQIVFLPGWLALSFLKPSDSLVRRLIISFGLSLMINYWLFFIFAAIHIYTIGAVLAVVLIEVVLLAYRYRAHMSDIRKVTLTDFSVNCIEAVKRAANRFQSWLSEEFPPGKISSFKLILSILVIGSVLYLAYLFVSNIGTVFSLSDPILSWNRWAVEWSTNALPSYTWEYPQLIPLNWSVFYVLVGAPIQFLPKMLMPLFIIGISLTFLSAGAQKKSWGYLAAIPATILLMRLMNGSAIMATEGYVDTAVAFFSTFSIVSLLWFDAARPKIERFNTLLIGALFAIGAAMTKQAGLYIAILFPLLAWLLVVRKDTDLKKKVLPYLLAYIGLLLLCIGPFYIYKELAIASHTDTSVVPTILQDLYGSGRSALAVLGAALYYLVTKTHGLILAYALLLLYAFKDKQYRYVVWLVIIPYTLVWGFFLSYDSRNLSLAMPLIGLAAGIGLEYVYLHTTAFATRKIRIGYCLVVFLLALTLVSPWVSKKIIAADAQAERSIYDPELSILVSNYFDEHPQGEIFTDLGFLYFLPATENRIWSPYGGFSPDRNDFDNYFKNNANPAATYILAAPYTTPDIVSDINAKISSGTYALIFRHNGYILVRTNNQ